MSTSQSPHPENNLSIRLLRLPQVRAIAPLSRSQIYLLMSQGKFPKPVAMGPRSVAWIADEVESWVAARIAESRPGGDQ